MALVPIISQTWDTTSVFNPTRMNNIEQNLAIVSDATGVKYSNGVSVKDKIDSMATVTVTGTIVDGNKTVAYPQGFTYDNCNIIGFMLKINSTRWDSFPNSNYPNATLVSLRNDNIYVYNSNANLIGLDFKLTLMKI